MSQASLYLISAGSASPSDPAGTIRHAPKGQGGPPAREDLVPARVEFIKRGRWAHADVLLCRLGKDCWVIKDFSPRSFLIRRLWGPWMVRREFRALQQLQGIEGVPQESFCVDRLAFGYRYEVGLPVSEVSKASFTAHYFEALESLVHQMHGRGLAHLDLRYSRNILMTERGKPFVMDFQSHVRLDRLPRWLRQRFRNLDLSGAYKHWAKRHPVSFTADRASILAAHLRWRRLWLWKGLASVKGWRRLTRRKAMRSSVPKSA